MDLDVELDACSEAGTHDDVMRLFEPLSPENRVWMREQWGGHPRIGRGGVPLAEILAVIGEQWISAAEIAERLGTTRVAVTSAIRRAREHGYQIESLPAPESGYRLARTEAA